MPVRLPVAPWPRATSPASPCPASATNPGGCRAGAGSCPPGAACWGGRRSLNKESSKKNARNSQEQRGQNLHIQQRLDLGYQQTDPRVQGPLSPPDLLSDGANPWKIQFPAAHTALSPPKGGPSPLAVVRPPVPSPSSTGRCGSQMMLPAPVALPVPVRGRASLIPHADGAGGFLERGWHLPGGPSLSQVTGAWGRRCRR